MRRKSSAWRSDSLVMPISAGWNVRGAVGGGAGLEARKRSVRVLGVEAEVNFEGTGNGRGDTAADGSGKGRVGRDGAAVGSGKGRAGNEGAAVGVGSGRGRDDA